MEVCDFPPNYLHQTLSRAYKFLDRESAYFVTFATVGWVDVFTRKAYKDVLVDSLRHCQRLKGLKLYAWCIMSNHAHLIAAAGAGHTMPDILRDLKKHTAKRILKMLEEDQQESRRDWMLSLFRKAGEANSNNTTYQFWRQDNRPIELFSNEVFDQKLEYVLNNPVVAGMVERPEHYVYSSAYEPALLVLEPQ